MQISEIYILGVGRNTEVFIDLVEACGYLPKGLFHYDDSRTGQYLHNVPILDSTANLFKTPLYNMMFAVSVGDNILRSKLSEQIRSKGGTIPTLIHPKAIVSKYSRIDDSVVVHPNAVIQAGASIARDTVISYGASVTHTSTVGKACYIAAIANVGAYVTIHDFVLIGQGAIIVSSKVSSIGNHSIVGAGSVVTKNVEANSIVAGNPARVIKQNLS